MLRRMVLIGGDVAEARRRHRIVSPRWTVSEFPHAAGVSLVNRISVIVPEPARNLSEEK